MYFKLKLSLVLNNTNQYHHQRISIFIVFLDISLEETKSSHFCLKFNFPKEFFNCNLFCLLKLLSTNIATKISAFSKILFTYCPIFLSLAMIKVQEQNQLVMGGFISS